MAVIEDNIMETSTRAIPVIDPNNIEAWREQFSVSMMDKVYSIVEAITEEVRCGLNFFLLTSRPPGFYSTS